MRVPIILASVGTVLFVGFSAMQQQADNAAAASNSTAVDVGRSVTVDVASATGDAIPLALAGVFVVTIVVLLGGGR